MSKEVIIHKIRHELGLDNSQLGFLLDLKEADLNLLFDKISDRLDSDQSDIWEKLAIVSKFMPAYITAKMSETVMGEVVSANVAAHMKTKDALKVLKHLSTNFLAKVSIHLHPQKCKELINSIPIATIKKVCAELLKMKEYYTLAGFVDVLAIEKVLDVIKVIESESDLLNISSFVTKKSLIANIVEQLPNKRIAKLINSAYTIDMREEIFAILTELSSDQMHRILNIVKGFPDQNKERIIDDLNKHFS